MNVFLYVALVAATLAGLTMVMAGPGLLLRRLFGAPASGAHDLLHAPMVGWALSLALLQVWHLFFPCDGRAFAALATVSAAGWL